ncbi:MAG: hypothetical protein HY966_05445 [Ignavibacteriales bacterium]|nr:hypothetical protein [Ignavibacteriales bacterium]
MADTLRFQSNTVDRPGEHQVSVNLNPGGLLTESDLSDNSASIKFVVGSSAFKELRPHAGLNYSGSEFVLLNPTRRPNSSASSVYLDLDTTNTFSSVQHFVTTLGMVVTKFDVGALQVNKRYFWRAGFSGGTMSQGTFLTSSSAAVEWDLRDSIEWSRNVFENTVYERSMGGHLSSSFKNVRIISSGFLDGSFGSVEIDGKNVLTSTFGRRGITVVVVDSIDLSVKDIRSFDTFASTQNAVNLSLYLQGLPTLTLVAMLVIDEAALNLNADARSAIKLWGSSYIDSLDFRDSWALFGKKGNAVPLKEAFVRSTYGKAIIDTALLVKESRGNISSTLIGPASKWISLMNERAVPIGASLGATVLGITSTGIEDTLILSSQDSLIDLSQFSATKYPFVRLVWEFLRDAIGASPMLRNAVLTVLPPAELAVNYQSVLLDADSVLEGTPVNISVDVFNPTKRQIDSVTVTLTDAAHGMVPIDTKTVASINSESAGKFKFTFGTAGKSGANTILVSVDPLQKIQEINEANNVYSLAFFVRRDTVRPSLDITFDGQRIIDGDYVSTTPNIVAMIYDNSPLPMTNPANAVVSIDGRRIALSGSTPDSAFIPGNGQVKAEIHLHSLLANGEHELSIQVQDASGNSADTTAKVVRFRVEGNSQLFNVLNFPNPFSANTVFTFHLSGSRIPDDLRIRIYTVAGRAIQELHVLSSTLHLGFNAIGWDGRDREGSEIANGVYFYKIFYAMDGKTVDAIQKLAKIK